ncbi:MAG: glycosyl transferase, partial [Alicyclobacillus sp.]|nr:glycosyl transferase [Alicyclobacillus sp.]
MPRLPVNLTHLTRMTDDTGLLEHAVGRIPRRSEGYSTDDNARALWLMTLVARWAEQEGDANTRAITGRLADTYVAFLAWVQETDGRFHNNIAYDRRWEPETPSEDCLGRALWATAVAGLHDPDPERAELARRLCQKAFPAVSRLRYPRGFAHALAAASLLLSELPHAQVPISFRRWAEHALPAYAESLCASLLASYRAHAQPGWHWFEEAMTYSNGVLPWALWLWGQYRPQADVLRVAHDSLSFLAEKMSTPQGSLRPIGNRGWCRPGQCSLWDQQPIELLKLALASSAAWEVSRDNAWRELLSLCHAWFYGVNDGGVAMADPADGSCCDGLTPNGPNPNRGAE